MEKYWDDHLVFPPAKGKAAAPDVADKDLPDDRQYTVKTLPQAASITASIALPTVTKTPKDSLLSEYDRKHQMRCRYRLRLSHRSLALTMGGGQS